MMNIALAAERILVEKLSSHSTRTSRSNEISRNIASVAGLAAAVGLGFLILSAHLWLKENYQANIAAALTGVLTLGIAGLLAALALIIVRIRQKFTRKLKHEIQELLQNVIESADEILTDPVRQNPKTYALLASIAGFIVGEKAL